MAIRWNPSRGATVGVEWELQLIDAATRMLRQDAREVLAALPGLTEAGDQAYQPLRVDPAIEQQQAERLAGLRAARDGAEFKRRIDDVRHAAEGTGNLLYPLREALRARATVGEVCDALRDVWGSYKPPDAY